MSRDRSPRFHDRSSRSRGQGSAGSRAGGGFRTRGAGRSGAPDRRFGGKGGKPVARQGEYELPRT
ncbi:ATP-dependent helicase, partial [Streptomyces sp. SID9727]|nr:ATP-dependent helicase [Streptomyces sp. SID9727]